MLVKLGSSSPILGINIKKICELPPPMFMQLFQKNSQKIIPTCSNLPLQKQLPLRIDPHMPKNFHPWAWIDSTKTSGCRDSGRFGCFQKIGIPQNGWFVMENPIKMDDLGVPLFSETPISTLRIIGPSKAWRHFEDPTTPLLIIQVQGPFHFEGPSDP